MGGAARKHLNIHEQLNPAVRKRNDMTAKRLNKDPKRIPLRTGLWTSPAAGKGKPHLIGSKCSRCFEIYFPLRKKGICINCQQKGLEEIQLSRRGAIYAFTIVMQRPPLYYKGPVPYALAWVELPEGVRLEALLSCADFETLKVGQNVELVIEKLHHDADGNEIVTYKFKPVDV